MFVIPGVIFGFFFSIIALNFVNTMLFTNDMGVDMAPRPSNFAIA
jgi:hypothetical protein